MAEFLSDQGSQSALPIVQADWTPVVRVSPQAVIRAAQAGLGLEWGYTNGPNGPIWDVRTTRDAPLSPPSLRLLGDD